MRTKRDFWKGHKQNENIVGGRSNRMCYPLKLTFFHYSRYMNIIICNPLRFPTAPPHMAWLLRTTDGRSLNIWFWWRNHDNDFHVTFSEVLSDLYFSSAMYLREISFISNLQPKPVATSIVILHSLPFSRERPFHTPKSFCHIHLFVIDIELDYKNVCPSEFPKTYLHYTPAISTKPKLIVCGCHS